MTRKVCDLKGESYISAAPSLSYLQLSSHAALDLGIDVHMNLGWALWLVFVGPSQAALIESLLTTGNLEVF